MKIKFPDETLLVLTHKKEKLYLDLNLKISFVILINFYCTNGYINCDIFRQKNLKHSQNIRVFIRRSEFHSNN